MTEIYGASETGGVGWRTDQGEAFALCSDLTLQEGALHRPGVEGPLPLQDTLDWPAPGRFRVKGRKDKQVQVGGVNVSLTSVREALLAMPGVQDAAVRLAEDRLKAFIVPAAPGIEESGLEADLRTGLTHLPAPARPARYAFGDALPRTATGKLCDWDTP